MSEQTPETPKGGSNRLALAFAASQMGLLVAAGLLGGLWLDKKWATTPTFGLIGLIAGFASGVRLLIQLVKTKD